MILMEYRISEISDKKDYQKKIVSLYENWTEVNKEV